MNIRPLSENEIECRVDTVNQYGVTLLLYKDARSDMKLMDETFGPMNWKRTHSVINGNLFCNVAVWDDKKGWVEREDVGVQSFSAKEKGEASDAFKRACVNWGIGRELYESPHIFASVPTEKVGDKWKQKDKYQKFSVKTIGYTDGAVSKLVIIDAKTKKVVFKLGDIPKEEPNSPQRNITDLGSEGKKHLQNNPDAQEVEIPCKKCGKTLTPIVHDESIKKYNKPLCLTCQIAADEYKKSHPEYDFFK